MPLIDVLVALVLVLVIGWLTRSYIPITPGFRSIVDVVLGLIVVGMLLWLVDSYVPMAGSIKGLLNIVVVIACCIWVLKAFGVWDQLVRWTRDFTHRRTPPAGI
jgi:hypothetical protein